MKHTLLILLMITCFGTSNIQAQETKTEPSTKEQLSIPKGFFPKWVDKQAYATKRVRRLTEFPDYYSDKPGEVAKSLAYLEFMIEKIANPRNTRTTEVERKKYLEMRRKIRSKIGIDEGASTSVAIAALYTIAKIKPESLKERAGIGEIRSTLENQGLKIDEIDSLEEVLEPAGFKLESVYTVADALHEIFDSDLDTSVADSIVDSLGLDGNTSFSDAVGAYNAAYGTSYTVDEAKEELGLDVNQDVGNNE